MGSQHSAAKPLMQSMIATPVHLALGPCSYTTLCMRCRLQGLKIAQQAEDVPAASRPAYKQVPYIAWQLSVFCHYKKHTVCAQGQRIVNMIMLLEHARAKHDAAVHPRQQCSVSRPNNQASCLPRLYSKASQAAHRCLLHAAVRT